MMITYKFAGFQEIEQKDNFYLFESDLSVIQDQPSYVSLEVTA
jgi:hypothetical protein